MKTAIVLLSFFVVVGIAQSAVFNFQATPLIDFTSNQLYLGKFPGLLYDGSNTPPADHDADGKSFAARVQPLDASGLSSATGKIVVVGIGMSNWAGELCRAVSTPPCTSNSFMGQALGNPSVNHDSLVLVDCGLSGRAASAWVDDSKGSYSTCRDKLLTPQGVTEKQVQVILYKEADAGPTHSLTSSTVCTAASGVDACRLEAKIGATARFIKTRYPNVKQMFLHSRIYAGYATTNQNPEPFAYETGFSVKWLVRAQINQRRGLGVDPTAGNLDYSVAPWIAWGPYFWASGSTPRSDGLVWLKSDFASDGTHPSSSAVTKVANMMMSFYLRSPYSPWFRSTGASGSGPVAVRTRSEWNFGGGAGKLSF